MEASIKLDEDEVIRLAIRHCNDLLPAPDSMRWVGKRDYPGAAVVCVLESTSIDLEQIPLVIATPQPIAPQPILSDEEVPF